MSDEAEVVDIDTTELEIEPAKTEKTEKRDHRGRFAEDLDNADKWLKENLRDEDDEPEQPKADVKPAKGKPAKEPSAKTDAPTDADKDEPVKEDKSKALEDSLKHLRLAGYTDDALDGLSEAKIIKLGAITKTRNDDFNKRLQQASTTKEKAAPNTASEPVKAEPTDDYVKQAAQRFREKYDGEFGQDLEDSLRDVIKGVTGKLSEENAGLQATVQELAFDAVRSSLKERFPQSETEEGSQALLNKMAELGQAKAHTSLKALARDAAMVLWGDEAIVQAQKDAADAAKRRAKMNGQPKDGGRDVKPRPAKHFDIDAAALAAVRGEPGENIRAAFNPRARG